MANIRKELEEIGRKWEADFKGDLFEGMEEIGKGELSLIINDFLQIWKQEDSDNISLYEEYEKSLKEIYSKI